MSKLGDNNPRGPFSEVLFLSVTRTAYDGNGHASLFVEVGFREGRIGASDDSPIRFRLGLKKAVVRIRQDAAKMINFDDKDVARDGPIIAKTKSTRTKSARDAKAIGVKLSASPSATLRSSRAKGTRLEQATKFAETLKPIAVQTWKDGDGSYSLLLSPTEDLSILTKEPWDARQPRLKLRDRVPKRNGGDPPEPVVQICCAIEDLEITDLEYKNKPAGFFASLKAPNRLAAVQYVRDQLRKFGLEAGNSDDPFAELVLADALPQEEA